ncbi:hypothetical protein GCM10022295_13880 [Streptomyces osmaniensis]|uniref:Uncharacterized protein n=1 Tax=Streptomyces osmaniensis TaxID=593134 RepID=A0ABP6VFW2_9ACTN
MECEAEFGVEWGAGSEAGFGVATGSEAPTAAGETDTGTVLRRVREEPATAPAEGAVRAGRRRGMRIQQDGRHTQPA